MVADITCQKRSVLPPPFFISIVEIPSFSNRMMRKTLFLVCLLALNGFAGAKLVIFIGNALSIWQLFDSCIQKSNKS